MNKQNKFIIISFLLGLIYTLLFYDKSIGISYCIYLGILSVSLLYILKKSEIKINNKAWLLLIPIFLVAFRLFMSSNVFFNFLNQKIVFILFIGMTILLIEHINNWGSFNFLVRIIERIFTPLAYLKKPYTIIFDNISYIRDLKWRSIISKIIIGLIISIPFLLVILVLLISADSVFGYTLKEFGKVFDNKIILDYIFRAIVTIALGTYFFAYIFSMQIESKTKYIQDIAVDFVKKLELDSVIMITVLTLINIIYIIFCSIQFSYLFSGLNGNSILPGGLTYAEYARKGFFELLFVTFINFSIILGCLNSVLKKSGLTRIVLKSLLLIISTATFIMLYSSFYRMGLYEEKFGYTYLRVFVYFFLALEAIMLLGTILYIIINRFNLVKYYIVTFLVCFIALNYMNVDKMIAKENIDRYFATGQIDIKYLTILSNDAIPEMTRLLSSKDVKLVNEVNKYFKEKKNELDSRNKSWFEYNYSSVNANRFITNSLKF